MILAELATRLGCRLEGDGTIDVQRVAGLDDAGPGDVTFLANPKYASKLPQTRASAVIANDAVSEAPCAVLRAKDPYLAFASALGVLMPPLRPAPGISTLAAIDPTAEIGPEVSVGPFVSIGAGARIGARTKLYPHVVIGPGTEIGEDCELHAHVSIRESVVIGSRVVLQDGAVIGGDGFGFAKRADGTHQKIPQVGRVVIEDDVEIGSNSAVDRPPVGETRIGAGTKIDNLVHLAHGVKVGKNVLLMALVGVAGSSVIEDDVILAGQVGVVHHIRVGRGVIAGAQSAITRDIEPGMQIAGTPAIEIKTWREAMVLVRRLPELRAKVTALEKRLADLADSNRS